MEQPSARPGEEKDKLMIHTALQVDNSPKGTPKADLGDIDLVEGEIVEENYVKEQRLHKEIMDLKTQNNKEDIMLQKIGEILSINEANPEIVKLKAEYEAKKGLFIDAMTSLQKSVNLDPKMDSCNTSYHLYKVNKRYLIRSNDI